MNVFELAVAAVVIQSIALAAFGFVGNAGWDIGKPLIFALTALAMGYLTWRGVKQLRVLNALFVLPAVFTSAYLVAFHVTGVLVFPGLLKDAELSADYFGALLRVGGVVLVGYMLMSGTLYLLHRWFDQRRNAIS